MHTYQSRAPCPVRRGGPRPARSKLEELLGRGSAPEAPARPDAGEHREFKLDRKHQRPEGEKASGAGRWGGAPGAGADHSP